MLQYILNSYFYNIKLFTFFEFYILECLVLIFTYLFIYFLNLKIYFYINLFSSLLLLLSSLYFYYYFNILNNQILINFNNIFKFFNLNICIALYIDVISYNFCFLTILISFSVYFYVYSYMRFEVNIVNFFFFLKSFVLSMLLLLIANNWLTILLGWELIGLTSFILINFWNNKISTLKSAFKAFSFNKISDSMLILGLLFTQIFQSTNFFNLYFNNSIYAFKYIYLGLTWVSYNDVFLILLIIASFCKSAQFGFHFWLPDSMEAPVPASALIHSATLVSAGIYLLLRNNYLLFFKTHIYYHFLIITSFTAFFGALIAGYQTDLKKILAYSTISHCGFLMVSLLFNNLYITLLYLFGHGFFKSLAFIGVGNLIQFSGNYQDFRKMGGFNFYYKYEYIYLLICLINLSSFPFMLNFFSKHFFLNYTNINLYVYRSAYISLLFASFMGIFYSIKFYKNTFFNLKKNNYNIFLINFFLKTNNQFKYFLFHKNDKLSLFNTIGLFLITLVVMYNFIILFHKELDLLVIDVTIWGILQFIPLIQIFFINILFFKIWVFLLILYCLFRQKNFILIKYLWLFIFIELLL